MCAQQAHSRNRQHTGARSDIENVPKPLPLGELREREQTAKGRPVMAGAESERSLNLDADVIGFRSRAVMRAVDDKTAGVHRLKSGKALGDPIGPCDPLEAQRIGRDFPGSDPDQFAQASFIRGGPEVDRELPAPVIVFECGTGSVLGIEGLTEIARKPPGGGFVAGQAGNGGGSVHRLQNSPFALARAMAI